MDHSYSSGGRQQGVEGREGRGGGERLLLITPDPQDRRPLDIIAEAGPAAKPIPFDDPEFFSGRYERVMIYFRTTDKFIQGRVLFRDYNDHLVESSSGGGGGSGRKVGEEEEEEEGNANSTTTTTTPALPFQVQNAYWPVPNKDKIPTIMGHVEICLLLVRAGDLQNNIFEWTGSYVAIKVNYLNRMRQLQDRHIENAWNEIAAMQLIGNNNSHPNVVGCIEVLNDGENINVVMPYYNGGDLFGLIHESSNNNNNARGFSEQQAKFWFRQLMAGIQHLHTVAGICHRDLSPENIVVHDNNTRCLIIDMGMAIRIPYLDECWNVTDITNNSANPVSNHRLLIQPQGRCGKLPYMSPEIYNNTKDFDGCAVDIWTSGVILFCMITGGTSYEKPKKSDPMYYWMVDKERLKQLLLHSGIHISPECLHLLQNILQVDPRLRLTLEEILNHPWLAATP